MVNSGKHRSSKRTKSGRMAEGLKKPITFHAPEYEQHEKSILWFFIAGTVALGFVLYGLMTDGWTFSLAIVAFCAAYYALHQHAPNVVEIKITRMGIQIGKHLFPYSRLRYFWIVYDPPHVKKLYIRFKGRFHPDINIALGSQDPIHLRNALRDNIEEWDDGDEPFIDMLTRALRL